MLMIPEGMPPGCPKAPKDHKFLGIGDNTGARTQKWNAQLRLMEIHSLHLSRYLFH